MGSELGSLVATMLEAEPWVGSLVGIDVDPPRRRLRRARPQVSLVRDLVWEAAADDELDAALARWIAPLDLARRARHAERHARSQSTRVDFFTVVRGENE